MEKFYAFIDWLQSIPVVCLIWLLYGVAFLLVPLFQWIGYRSWVKQYGKEEADEMARRY